MECSKYLTVIVKGLENTSSTYSSTDYSLRSQYFRRFKTITNQCLDKLIAVAKESEPLQLQSTLIKLKCIMDAKLHLTAEEDLEKDQLLYKMLLENDKIELKMSEMRVERGECEIKFDALLESKLDTIECLRNLVNDANDSTISYLESEVYRSEINMKSHCEKNVTHKISIERELKIVEERLQYTLLENLEKEQAIRKKKIKTQQALKTLLDNYDQEVGSRTRTLKELNTIYSNEESFLRNLEDTCANQEKKYNFLMNQKEVEERRLQEERMLLFMMNRAARIIQRNWRLVMAKKRLKKGKRGKGKGKKS